MKIRSLLTIAGVVSLLFGCGGGGGDEDGLPDDGEIVTLGGYSYSISAIPGGTDPFTVTLGNAVIGVDPGNTITGTVDIGHNSDVGFIDDDDVFFTDQTIAPGSTFSVDSDLGSVPGLGAFDVSVVNEIAFFAENPPTTGVLDVVTTTTPSTENIRITVAGGDVQLSLNNGQPESMSWNEFEGLLDSNLAPDWQKRAALAARALEFVYIRAFDITKVLALIDDSLPGNNPKTVMCDQFPGIFPGPVDQGMAVLTWLGSGDLQPGDNFNLQLTDCWLDEPFKDRNELLNGTVHLNGYTEVIDDNNRITRIGFEPSQSSPGGVIFENYEIQGLVEIPPVGSGDYSFDSGDPAVLNGGFSVVFFEP